jgi:hypothetical protein
MGGPGEKLNKETIQQSVLLTQEEQLAEHQLPQAPELAVTETAQTQIQHSDAERVLERIRKKYNAVPVGMFCPRVSRR